MRKHIIHILTNKIRALALGLSRARLARGAAGHGALIRKHSRAIEHLSAAFALLADVTLLVLGGDLKRREMLSGRFADALGNLYLASATLKKFHDDGELAEDAPLADWACGYALFQAQQALDGILRNYPRVGFGFGFGFGFGRLLRVAVFGGGRYLRMPADVLSQQVATLLQTPGPARERLTEHVYLPAASGESVAQLEAAFVLMEEVHPLRRRLRKAGHRQPATGQTYRAWLAELCAGKAINATEEKLLNRAHKAVGKVIRVDAF